jgi:hypothetical protein
VAQPKAHVQQTIARAGAIAPSPVQRLAHGAAPLPPQLARLPYGGGQPLPPAVRQKMERLFGASFADVRIHHGPHASSIGALAFTRGSDIHFAPGQYNPATAQGQKLLAHELAHVVQQRSGRVRTSFGADSAIVHDPVLQAEAQRIANRAATWQLMPAHRVIQRAGGQGLPEEAHIDPGAFLTHGSPVAIFDPTREDGAGPSLKPASPLLPSAPAWFAIMNPEFSVHAAARFIERGQNGVIHVHAYLVTKRLTLLRFDDFADFAAFVSEQDSQAAPTSNTVAAAVRFAKLASSFDGYQLDADLVRGEPEVILFDSGLAKLQPYVVSKLVVAPTIFGHQSIKGMGGSDFDYDRSGGGPGTTNMIM